VSDPKDRRFICGASCHYGGLSANRKHSAAPLGWMWHRNRAVVSEGARCYQHKVEGDL